MFSTSLPGKSPDAIVVLTRELLPRFVTPYRWLRCRHIGLPDDIVGHHRGHGIDVHLTAMRVTEELEDQLLFRNSHSPLQAPGRTCILPRSGAHRRAAIDRSVSIRRTRSPRREPGTRRQVLLLYRPRAGRVPR